jgi:hypothetical protein
MKEGSAGMQSKRQKPDWTGRSITGASTAAKRMNGGENCMPNGSVVGISIISGGTGKNIDGKLSTIGITIMITIITERRW